MIDGIIQKISSYNIFNYLLPGVVFVVFFEMISLTSLVQENIIVGLFAYYFIGMVISRVGSLIIEPTLKKLKILKFAPYKCYVRASKADKKIELLSEVNNTYRTVISLFLILILTVLLEYTELYLLLNSSLNLLIIFIIIFIIFIFSYLKQTDYITKRIDSNLDD